MSTRTFNRARLIMLGLLAVTATLVAVPATSLGEEMTMSPHKIILNAQGQFEDAQAVIRIAMRPGYSLTDYYVTLQFDGVPVSEAFDFRYCTVDDNFLASFDRTALQANPAVIAMANRTVCATVAGWFTGTATDGSSYTQEFSCTDLVEILDPEKK